MLIRLRFEADPELMKVLRDIASSLSNTARQQQQVDSLAARLSASSKRLKAKTEENQ